MAPDKAFRVAVVTLVAITAFWTLWWIFWTIASLFGHGTGHSEIIQVR